MQQCCNKTGVLDIIYSMFKPKRQTKIKQAILELLQEHHFLTATQLVSKLHEQGIAANKTSVYRNLESFLEDNVICQQSFETSALVYELQGDHHDHVHCRSCGKVEEIPCHFQLPQTVGGYTIEHHHLTLYGLCQKCQAKTSE